MTKGSPLEMLDGGVAWRCPAVWDDLSAPRQLARIAFDPAAPPRFLVSRNAALDRITVAWRNQDGSAASLSRTFNQLEPTYLDRRFLVRLPDLPAGTDSVVVAVDHPTNALPLDYLELTQEEPGTGLADRDALLIAALLVGMLAMPIFFDLVFFRILREPFILWHIAFVVGMAIQLVMSAGLFLPFVDIGLYFVRAITAAGFGLMVVGSLMFLSTFVERGLLSARQQWWLRAAAAWMAAVCALHAAGITALGTLSSQLLYLSGIPIAMLFGWAIWSAVRAGSRMILYVIVGFAPLLLVIAIRVASYLLPGMATHEANGLFQMGMVVEVGATALGVATRFLALRNERDRAQSEVRDLEDIAERDPLTGLLNRRAVEPRFAELRRTGYETFALLDLDHFKMVNDEHGHAVGDAVLVATAEILAAEPETVAMRFGGEEFLLLMRGDDAEQRADRLRASIPLRVASRVEGLSRPVTASMGLVVAPHAAVPRAKFNDLYVMADRLLYEAKSAGRNRTLRERIRAFRRPRRDRRRAA